MDTQSRLALLQQQTALTGIDFVFVHPDQKIIEVRFLVDPGMLVDDLDEKQIVIYSPAGDTNLSPIPVVSLEWTNASPSVLKVTAGFRGDFTVYKLRIDDERIDPCFNDVCFSFKVNCPTDVDCRDKKPECLPEQLERVSLDYQARDFWSLRRALLDFASLRYPEWQDRLEADMGIMLVEVMSALGDELAYYQDRIGREAYLETATQRRSLRRHARLVDYPMHDGLGSSTWLNVQVKSGQKAEVPAGTPVWVLSDAGEIIDFEIGKGLDEINEEKKYMIDSALNELTPYLWDKDKPCLSPGSNELYLTDAHSSHFGAVDEKNGKWVLLAEDRRKNGLPSRKWMVRLTKIEDTEDKLRGQAVTRIQWDQEQALPFELDLRSTTIHANMVPVTAGRTQEKHFYVGDSPDLSLPTEETATMDQAVIRVGANGRVAYLYSLPDEAGKGLVWQTRGADWLSDDPINACPEIDLRAECGDRKEQWQWRRSFLGMPSSSIDPQRFASGPLDPHFTLEDGMWKRVAGFRKGGTEIVHYDYADGRGTSIRFGDQEFGALPPPGTVFRVTYRVGSGRKTNAPADSITHFDPSGAMFGIYVDQITNPFEADNGKDPETLDEVRMRAPHAFQEIAFRAVTSEDYAEAAGRLPWVQKAGASFRWTGSWFSAFVTPDPLGAVVLSEDRRDELEGQMDRFRQTGREVHVLDPCYADVHLRVTICVEQHAYGAQVKEQVMERLFGRKDGSRTEDYFFFPDRFTFGMPLERSQLEGWIQRVPGVRAVLGVEIRRIGKFNWRDFSDLFYPVAMHEVIRVENDPLRPERGSLQLILKGGA